MKFIDLFAGLGGFHRALSRLGHECVFASEIDEELRLLYAKNFPETRSVIHGDIRLARGKVPAHDILCAGFPCQPFSKSGSQQGRRDRTRGTLFHEILSILKEHEPKFVILENVGNFERHNRGRTWQVVRESLAALGYNVRGTEHITSGGHGLISPHHFGFPHTRERFFVVASLDALPKDPFPVGNRAAMSDLMEIVQVRTELTTDDVRETALTKQQIECIEHWNRLLVRLPSRLELPSFPIWGDEIDAKYPFEQSTPFATPEPVLRKLLLANGRRTREELLELLPRYARTESSEFPSWKVRFIKQNRDWFGEVKKHFPNGWTERLAAFPPSLRKLEWNCKGEERDLWRHVLQFRPSGLRVKRLSSSPALVAMTTTQIPILGPKRRFLTRTEGLRLQRFPDSHRLPAKRGRAFAALGNAVHVDVVRSVAQFLTAAP